MCWYSKSEPIRKYSIADMTVYKVFRLKDGKLYSPIQKDEIWRIGIEKSMFGNITVETEGTADYMMYRIDNGLHSLNEKPETIKTYNEIDPDSYEYIKGWYVEKKFILEYTSVDVLCKCIVPAGSTYYINDDHEVVSNRLKIIQMINP